MMLAFICNGICTFGLRILAGSGVGERYTSAYLVLWYLGGAILLAVVHFPRRERPRVAEVAVGGALGLASVVGQTSIGLALSGGLPGSIVYPVTLAGGLFLVAGAGVLLFDERVGRYGLAGIALGVASIVLLTL
jgi:multidrug transporter EmrE-like cation transporter